VGLVDTTHPNRAPELRDFKVNYKHRFHLLIFAVFVSGCSSVVSVTEHQKANFNTNDAVTVICKTNDLLHLQGELEHLLLARGYDVVSEEVAVRKAKSNINMDYNNNRVQGGIESYNTTELGSVYALTFSYSYRFDGSILHDSYKITQLYGSLIDLRTGKIAKSLKINRSIWSLKGNSEFLEKLLDQMQ
jgi:hypothetical protein